MQPGERSVPDVSDHGGNLAAARRRFPDVTESWIDLSTGISPFPYPYSPVAATAWERLPEPEQEAALREAAASAYAAPSAGHVAAGPGTQMLLPFVFGLRPPGKVIVLGPTYAEHRRVAALCGHECVETERFEDLDPADIAVVVNPNNPDGRVIEREQLISLAKTLGSRGGLLVVDEAFMEVVNQTESMCGAVEQLPVVVLRSFGKFHGLAGIRLGFAIASEAVAATLRAWLGPWAVSGPALVIGTEALSDEAWRVTMRARLAVEAKRLGDMLEAHGFTPAGGTDLFQLARHDEAGRAYEMLGRSGILVRPFEHRPDVLRFGLPGDDAAWARLERALARFNEESRS